MKKLSLQKLSQNELEKREMNQLIGGGNNCRCGCAYVMTDANYGANKFYGYTITATGTGGSGACWCAASKDAYNVIS